MSNAGRQKRQTLVGLGVLALGLGLGAGAYGIPSDAGYAGVGPNFLPWVVSAVLVLCGGWVIREARSGGFRGMEPPSGAEDGHWPGFVWVSAGLLLNALLITSVGFILSCTLCFTLAVRGLRTAEGRHDMSPRSWLVDIASGAAIAAPVYWMFTKLLAINLPGLTATGWI
ncbi:MAG TPA: tripartite tricarboxylate transporter TctB family protein [Rhodoferax sp.]|jgi:putative tricarboxylic transport membrane protein|nr:tripartite tricarboxylate transporter TctB family protein [Rhodoferax sp.]HPW84700.1 tripartite tricarboxylate transporter TctB family protein [Rhodoferax sp.]HQC86395.1 tripartite tricarboxylate transporter TctB family protein [Rhodoferax sp.]